MDESSEPDFRFTDRPKESWTFDEANLWDSVIRDPDVRAQYREYLALNNAVIRHVFQLCRQGGIVDHATQDSVAMIFLEKMQRDEQIKEANRKTLDSAFLPYIFRQSQRT